MLFRLFSAALFTETLWILSLFIQPWNKNIYIFLGIYGISFIAYLLTWRTIKNKNLPAGSLPIILLAALVFRITLFFAPPSLSDDIYRYAWDGKVQNAGINPYIYAPNDEKLNFLKDRDHQKINHKNIRTIYPPFSQITFRLTYSLSPSMTAQRLVFMGFDTAIIFLLILYLRKKKKPTENVLLYAWNPLVLIEFSSSGHLDSMGIFFLMAGLLAYEKRDTFRTGFFWGLSFLSKLGSIILLPWLLLKKQGQKSLIPLVLTIFGGYFLYLTLPLMEIKKFLFSGTMAYAKSWSFNAGIYALIVQYFPFSSLLLKGLIGGTLLLLAILLIKNLKDDDILIYTGILFAASLAVSPVVHPWYIIWIIPFLCFFPLYSGILLTGLIGLSYIVLHQYSTTGLWKLPLWVPWVEYTTTLVILLYEIKKFLKRKKLPTFNSSPLGPLKPTLIIPALNEEKSLPLVLQEIPQKTSPHVIVVDNGSTDRTRELAQKNGAEVITENRRGYGQAILSGLQHLPQETNVIVIMDGDHSDYPEDLNSLLAPIMEGKADFVIGSRVLGGAPPESLTPQQRFGNALSCHLIRLFFGQRFTDLGPFRAIRRDLLEALQMEDKNFGWNVEMQIKAILNGACIQEVPVRYRSRIGISKISGTVKGTILAGYKILGTIFRYGCFPQKGIKIFKGTDKKFMVE